MGVAEGTCEIRKVGENQECGQHRKREQRSFKKEGGVSTVETDPEREALQPAFESAPGQRRWLCPELSARSEGDRSLTAGSW